MRPTRSGVFPRSDTVVSFVMIITATAVAVCEG